MSTKYNSITYRQKLSSSLYSIEECVGRGNFGDVYKAKDNCTGQVVAIKVVNLEHSEEDIDILAQEIFFLAELKNPYITNYITTLTDDVCIWIVMEYCAGGSCADLIKLIYTNGLPENKVAYIINQILHGLEYLHNERKIHRDIKAANILLTESGMVKLGDFGVSGQIKATMKRDTFVGTPYWMAPEVVSKASNGYDEKADIWSLGITVYELLKGLPPLAKYDPVKVMANLPKKKPPKLLGNFTDTAKRFVASCLSKEPQTRPSAKQLLKDPFVKNLSVTNLAHDVQLLNLKKRSGGYLKAPMYPVGNKVYSKFNKTGLTGYWNFDTIREKEGKIHILSPTEYNNMTSSQSQNSPLSSTGMGSPYRHNNQTVTPITNPSFDSSIRNYKDKNPFELGSGMEIDPEIAIQPSFRMVDHEKYPVNYVHNEQELLREPSMMQEKETLDPLHMVSKLEGYDYLKTVIIFSFKRMYERAQDDETRLHVEEMLQKFVATEAKVGGFSEVFIEEVCLRMDSIKKYIAK